MDAATAAQRLLSFPIFKDLTSHIEAMQSLASRMQHQVFQARQFIIDEKKPDDRMYFLIEGEVTVNKMDEKGQLVVVGRASSKTHSYFGEAVLLGKSTRSANVMSHTLCECLSLSGRDFGAFMTEHPLVAASIYRNIAIVLHDRLAKANRDLLIATLE